MASYTGLMALVAVFSMAAAEKVDHLPDPHARVSAHSRRKHHMHPSHMKARGGVSHHSNPHIDQQFGAIQRTLIGAWKEKTHLEHLESSSQAQKALLDKQKQLLFSDNTDVTPEERKQVLQMYHMFKESRALTDKVRASALKKTEAAMADVLSINTAADELIAHNNQDILDMKLKIAQDVAANAEANRTQQRAKKVLAAALQEAKYFQTALSQAATEKQESVNEENSMRKLVDKFKERYARKDQGDEAGVEQDEGQRPANVADRGSGRDDQGSHMPDEKFSKQSSIAMTLRIKRTHD